MKKKVNVLGFFLSLLLISSCSDDNDKKSENATPEGVYSYSSITVKNAVDLNGDGVSNTDLMKEGFRTCSFDNQLKFTDTTYSFILAGESCSSDSIIGSVSYTYKYDENSKKVTLSQEGTVVDELSNFTVSTVNGVKQITFTVFDLGLNQDLNFTMILVK